MNSGPRASTPNSAAYTVKYKAPRALKSFLATTAETRSSSSSSSTTQRPPSTSCASSPTPPCLVTYASGSNACPARVIQTAACWKGMSASRERITHRTVCWAARTRAKVTETTVGDAVMS